MEVLKKEEKILSREEAAEFYKQHEGTEHFDQLVEFMSRCLFSCFYFVLCCSNKLLSLCFILETRIVSHLHSNSHLQHSS